jgi:hypothetical protein
MASWVWTAGRHVLSVSNLLVGLPIILLFLMSGLLLYFLGFEPRHEWNSNAIETDCIVIQQEAVPATCREGSDGKYIYTCFQGYVTMQLNSSDGSFERVFKVAENRSMAKVINKMNENYPMGKAVTCYYIEGDEENFRRQKHSGRFAPGLYLGFFCMFIICAGCLCVGMFYLIFGFD